MGTRRKHLGCAVYQDMIYSVGGRDDTTELSSAERYNPRSNQWSPVVAMTSRRSGVSGLMYHAHRHPGYVLGTLTHVIFGGFVTSGWNKLG